MTHDGLGKYLSQIIEKAPGPTADIVGILKEREVDVMVSYLPGRQRGGDQVVRRAGAPGRRRLHQRIPVFIGREPYWQRRFAEAGLPVIGDDIKSQVGATISHRVLTRLFMDRGVRLDRTYQLNFGGNTDFLNMLERERLESKKISKTNAVTSMLDYEMDPDDVHVGPSDHVPWLLDRKWCYIRMEGTTFGDVPLNAELKLEVWDSPNSAGVITDAIRCLKLGLDRGLKGTLVAPSSYFMKSPPHADPRRHRVQPGRGVHPRRGQRDARRHRGAGQADAQAAGRRRRPRSRPPRRSDRRPTPTDRSSPTATVDSRRRIDAAGGRPRVVERLAILGLPRDRVAARAGCRPAVARPSLGRLAQASYLLWPTKRRWSNQNFGHVLGLPPDDPRVRRLALRAYREYGRYLVELMRLPRVARPTRSPRLVPDLRSTSASSAIWQAPRGGGLIFAVGHVGNNEAVAAAIAQHGLPISVVADDSAFPELFEHLRDAARGVGRPDHPVAEPAGDLRRAPAAARCSALLVDWGYRDRRHPGPPVRRLDDAAGRSGDAGRQDRVAHPARRHPRAGRTAASTSSWGEPIDVAVGRAGRAPAGDPGDGRRARGDRSRPRPSSGTASSRSGRRPPPRGPTSSGGRGDAGRAARSGPRPAAVAADAAADARGEAARRAADG